MLIYTCITYNHKNHQCIYLKTEHNTYKKKKYIVGFGLQILIFCKSFLIIHAYLHNFQLMNMCIILKYRRSHVQKALTQFS